MNTTETPWAHLPNAVHIKRIIDSVEANPDAWKSAYITAHDVPRDAVKDAAWGAAYKVRDATRDAAWRAAWHAARNTARGDAARNAVLALIAYDDAAQYLDLTLDELKELYASTGHPATLLLQPAAVAFANINE
jgi:hypothetical protein